MFNKNVMGNLGTGSQLFFLFFTSFAGLIGCLFLVAALGNIIDISAVDQDKWLLFQRLSQFLSTVCIFILPALLCTYMFYSNPKQNLKLEKSPSLTTGCLILLLVIAIQPIVALMSEWNKELIPESMTWIHEIEKSASLIIEKFIADKTIIGIASNLFIIAILAGIGEELFFRGCMQQMIGKIAKNDHLAIWITAIIFSTIHFQFYGFFPRILLGALLGYLFVWSRNLWVPIIAHTLHNALNVAAMQYYYGTPQYDNLENINVADYWWLVLISIPITGYILYALYRSTKKTIRDNTMDSSATE